MSAEDEIGRDAGRLFAALLRIWQYAAAFRLPRGSMKELRTRRAAERVVQPTRSPAGAAAPVVWEFEHDRHRALLLQVLEAEPGSRMREVAIGALERYEHERDQARRRWSPERRSWEQQHGMEQQHAHPVQARRPRPEIEMRIEP